MTTPIACSLSAGGYRRRVAAMGDLARRSLRSSTPIQGGVRHAFADEGDVRARLEGFVAAEAACCPFLTLDLRATGGELLLDVTGPLDAQPLIGELFRTGA